ncbi:hypothetical protein BC831DRAFT_504787 [Entophlyctis helioformis]|nr:hypothetical protein BC831DRAFT_504787 [Entophlyctis helioformis]
MPVMPVILGMPEMVATTMAAAPDQVTAVAVATAGKSRAQARATPANVNSNAVTLGPGGRLGKWSQSNTNARAPTKTANIFDAAMATSLREDSAATTARQSLPLEQQLALAKDAIDTFKEAMELKTFEQDVQDITEQDAIDFVVKELMLFLLDPFVAGIEDDLADFPNAWKVLSAIFVPLIESSLLSLASFIRIINGTNGYQSVIPVGPVAAFDTLDKLDPKLFVQLLVAEQTDLRSIWPADNNSDAAIAKFQSRRKQPTVDALSFVVTAVRNETADDADLVASPAFVPATAKAIATFLYTRVVTDENGKARPNSPELYTEVKDRLAVLSGFMKPHIKTSADKVAVLVATEESTKTHKDLFVDLFRQYYELELIDEAAYMTYKKSASDEAAKALKGWFSYLESQN